MTSITTARPVRRPGPYAQAGCGAALAILAVGATGCSHRHIEESATFKADLRPVSDGPGQNSPMGGVMTGSGPAAAAIPEPAWRADLLKAAALIDRPKQAAVDSFGAPTTVVQDINHIYPPTYEYDLPSGKLLLRYNAGGTLDFADMSPAIPPRASEVWGVLARRRPPPTDLWTPIWDCKRYLLGGSAGACAISAEVKGNTGRWPFTLTGTTAVPPWTGTAAFDVNTSTTNIVTLVPNPQFSWGAVSVSDIVVGRQKYRSLLNATDPWPRFSLPLTPQNVEQS